MRPSEYEQRDNSGCILLVRFKIEETMGVVPL